MTKKYSLEVKSRTQEKPKDLRQQGKIPAVVYGHGFKNINLSVDFLKIERAYEQVGESNLFDLIIDDQQPIKVVIKAINYDPISGRIIHVDFYKVRMDEKITVEVPLEFIGESRAVKDLGGVLVKNLDSFQVECLPGDLISKIEVDLSKLCELGDMIRVGDLKIPDYIIVQNDSDDPVVVAEESKKPDEKDEPAKQLSAEAVKESPDKGTNRSDKKEEK